jgi:beta-glucosidase
MNTSLSPDERANLILAQMTLAEKVGMLSEQSGAGLLPSRLGIPTLTFADGPAGIRIDRSRRDVNEGKATSPPAPIALAATWDPLAAQQYGDLVGLEAWSTGHNVLFGPGVDIVRIAGFGRLFESLGEDPVLTGQMAARYIQGVQSHAVIATAKHYNVNAQEENRLEMEAQLDERTLQEIYTLPFEAAVKDGHIGAVMGAYNKINGTYCCENPHILTEILRQQLGFKGWVVSDFQATHSTVEAANAGLDVELDVPPAKYFGTRLLEAIQAGQVSMATIDDKVRRILYTMFAFGLFDRPEYAEGTEAVSAADLLPGPPLVPSSVLTPTDVPPDLHGLHAEYWTNTSFEGEPRLVRVDRQVGLNLGLFNAGILNACSLPPVPEEFNNMMSVRWTGSLTAPATGSYTFSLTHLGTVRFFLDGRVLIDDPGISLQTQSVTLPLVAGEHYTLRIEYAADRPEQYAPVPGELSTFALIGAKVRFGWEHPADGIPSAIQEAAALARQSDVAVVVVRDYNSEHADRPGLTLPNEQDLLVQTVVAANPRTVVVIASGGPVLMPWLDQVPAVLESWYGGQEVGNALFPFGYGLSYTSFAYSQLQVKPETTDGIKPIQVSFTVTNTGTRLGAEIAQVYLGLPASVGEPPQRLAGWAKIAVESGESREVSVTLDPNATSRPLSYWNVHTNGWEIASGDYQVFVGASSRDIRLTGSLRVQHAEKP